MADREATRPRDDLALRANSRIAEIASAIGIYHVSRKAINDTINLRKVRIRGYSRSRTSRIPRESPGISFQKSAFQTAVRPTSTYSDVNGIKVRELAKFPAEAEITGTRGSPIRKIDPLSSNSIFLYDDYAIEVSGNLDGFRGRERHQRRLGRHIDLP